MPLRISLTGDIALEGGPRAIGGIDLPGVQGRVLLAMLVWEHRRFVARDEIADELWGETRPPAWDTGLRALVSKTRAALASLSPDGAALIATAPACYRFCLPVDGEIDVERAQRAIHDGETAWRRGEVDAAGAAALVAGMIVRRPFLPEATGAWVRERQAIVADLRLRALDVLAGVWLCKGDYGQAARDAEAAIRLDPYHETAYQTLILAHVRAGNPARAIAVYRECCRVLADDLDAEPSAATRAAYREAWHATD